MKRDLRLTYLSAALGAAMRDNKLRAVDVSRKTKMRGRTVASSFLSRLINSHQAYVAPDDLELIARCITNDRRARAEIYKARLLDECPEEAFQTIDIQFRSGKLADPADWLSQEGRRALYFLLSSKSPHVQNTLIELAALVGMEA